jgi:hypothetical protein
MKNALFFAITNNKNITLETDDIDGNYGYVHFFYKKGIV